MALDRVDVWFQDEARFGQQNTTTRLWAEKGTRPRAIRQQQFEYVHIYGAACPSSGQTEALISPLLGKDAMRIHLKQISDATPAGRHAVIIMDRAGWHGEDLADEFPNISIIRLPPYSPELNPIEQVWQWLRQRELANRCFDGYDDIVEQVSRAWNSFRGQTGLVQKICSRDWINLITI